MADWLGGMQFVDMLPLKFNGKSLGVWAVCVGAEGRDDIVIRRPAASDAVPVSSVQTTAALTITAQEITMNIHINHFSLGARNAFESAARLRKETGLSFWTGEWVRDISCHMVPLGNGPQGKDAFIEIQCFVDAHAHLQRHAAELSLRRALGRQRIQRRLLDRSDARRRLAGGSGGDGQAPRRRRHAGGLAHQSL